MKFQRI